MKYGAPHPLRDRANHRVTAHLRAKSSGQSLVEFVLILPIMLVLLGVAVDFGRLFYTYVAVENAAKEGALVGARSPLCNQVGASGCGNPNNVKWHVENEAPNLVDGSGNSLLSSTVACRRPDGTLVQAISDCLDGDTYQVEVSAAFRMVTPLVSSFLPSDFTLKKMAQATVITDAFDPSGLEVLVWVSSMGSTNSATIASACTQIDVGANLGYFYQPCQDLKNVDNYLEFNESTTVNYRVRVRNTGNIDLTGITYSFSENGTAVSPRPGNCSALPTSLLKTASPVFCNFQAPATVTDPAAGMNNDTWAIQTTARASGIPTGVGSAGAAIKVAPAPRLAIDLKAGPYRLGDTGDGAAGEPSYSSGNRTLDRDTASSLEEIRNPVGWLYLTVKNNGGPADSFTVSVTRDGSSVDLPVSCVVPATLAESGQPGDTFTCDPFPATFTGTQTYHFVASASATNAKFVSGTQPAVNAITSTCNGGKKVVPNLVDNLGGSADGTVGRAKANWPAAGFTGGLTVNPAGAPDDRAVTTQTLAPYACQAASSGITVTAP